MKKLFLISSMLLALITSSFAYQSTETCGVSYYGGDPNFNGYSASQTVAVQQACDVVLEASTSTYGFALAYINDTYVYADYEYIRYDSKLVINVTAGQTIYLSAMITPDGCGFCFARATFGIFHN